jgi:hypothetical protein
MIGVPSCAEVLTQYYAASSAAARTGLPNSPAPALLNISRGCEGTYTAIVRGAQGTTSVALVEAYNLQ